MNLVCTLPDDKAELRPNKNKLDCTTYRDIPTAVPAGRYTMTLGASNAVDIPSQPLPCFMPHVSTCTRAVYDYVQRPRVTRRPVRRPSALSREMHISETEATCQRSMKDTALSHGDTIESKTTNRASRFDVRARLCVCLVLLRLCTAFLANPLAGLSLLSA